LRFSYLALVRSRTWEANHPERMRELKRRWRAAHPEVAKRNNLLGRARNRAFIAAEAQRRGGLCEAPGCNAHFEDGVLQWHHRDPSTRSFSIGNSSLASLKKIVAELAKCDLLCRGHHLIAEGERLLCNDTR